jgi:hypothetical protein
MRLAISRSARLAAKSSHRPDDPLHGADPELASDLADALAVGACGA